MILRFPHKKVIKNSGEGLPGIQYVSRVESLTSNSICEHTHNVSVEMSIELLAAVWQLKLPIHEKFVLLGLADYANSEDYCWPCMKTLSEKCSMGVSTARGAVAALEKKGLLFREYRRGHANRFYLKIPRHNTAVVRHNAATEPSITGGEVRCERVPGHQWHPGCIVLPPPYWTTVPKNKRKKP